MDFLNLLDGALIGAIIAIMEVLKSMDTAKKFTRWYPFVVLILALVAAAFKANPFTWQTFGYNAILYAGASSYIYKLGRTTILGK